MMSGNKIGFQDFGYLHDDKIQLFEQSLITHKRPLCLNKTEKRVIELLIENPGYTSAELAERIGVTKRTIERAFNSLQEKKIIERIGSKRDGNWIVVR